jgi:DNA polymerase-1
MAEKLLLVDAYSLIYRAFYAIRGLTGPDGKPVNAIFGFTKMLRKLRANHEPRYCAVVFDLGVPQHRISVLPSYKEHRPPTPPDLDSQLPAIREVLEEMRVPIIEVRGEEADDIIGSLAVQAANTGMDVLIASNDKDFMQIVGDRICLIRPDGKESVICDAAGVQARYGVKPDQIVDLLSLIGDSVDNVRGVPGIGEKTAADLLQRYGTLDNLLTHTAEISKPRLRESLVAHREQVQVSRSIVKLRLDLTVPVHLEDLRCRTADYPRLIETLRQFGFKSLIAELEKERAAPGDLFAS